MMIHDIQQYLMICNNNFYNNRSPIQNFITLKKIQDKQKMYQIKPQNYSSLYYKDQQNPQDDKNLKKCHICSKKFKENQIESLWPCNHEYCIECLKYYIIYNLKKKYIVKCPQILCEQVVSKSTLQSPLYCHKKSLAHINKNTNLKICQICDEALNKEKMINLCSCQHQYCQICLTKYLQYKIQNQFSFIRCPHSTCEDILNTQSNVYKSLPDALKFRYLRIVQNIKIISNQSTRICPNCPNTNLTQLKNQQNLFCTKCLRKYCPKCLNLAHRKFAKCENSVASILKYNLNFMRCENCKFIVEKKQGCNHMTCVCGYQFCYLCGKYWQGYSHKCPPKPVFIKPKPVQRKIIPPRQIISLPKKNIQFNISRYPLESESKKKMKGSKPNVSMLFYSHRQKKQKAKRATTPSTKFSSSIYSIKEFQALI